MWTLRASCRRLLSRVKRAGSVVVEGILRREDEQASEEEIRLAFRLEDVLKSVEELAHLTELRTLGASTFRYIQRETVSAQRIGQPPPFRKRRA
jgi:hypothetical protein